MRSPSETTSRSHACMTVPVVFVVMLLTLSVIAAMVAMEIEHASRHSDNTQPTILQPANNVRTWRPLAGGFEARFIGSYCVLPTIDRIATQRYLTPEIPIGSPVMSRTTSEPSDRRSRKMVANVAGCRSFCTFRDCHTSIAFTPVGPQPNLAHILGWIWD